MNTLEHDICMANACVPTKRGFSGPILPITPYENGLLFAVPGREKLQKMTKFMIDTLLTDSIRTNGKKDPECFFAFYATAFVFYNTLSEEKPSEEISKSIKQFSRDEPIKEKPKEYDDYESKMILKALITSALFMDENGKVTARPVNAEAIVLRAISELRIPPRCIIDKSIIFELMRANNNDEIRDIVKTWPNIPILDMQTFHRDSHLTQAQKKSEESCIVS